LRSSFAGRFGLKRFAGPLKFARSDPLFDDTTRMSAPPGNRK
jgi:hypothetical protein